MSPQKTKSINLENKYKLPQSVIDGVHAQKTEIITEFLESIDHSTILTRAMSLVEHPPKGTFKQLQAMRSCIQELIKYVLYQRQLLSEMLVESERMSDSYAERGNRRWSPIEDDALIELVTSDTNLIQLSLTFGRSPSAIQSRITHLVGIKRISKEIAGRFVGTLDNFEVEGFIVGTVTQ